MDRPSSDPGTSAPGPPEPGEANESSTLLIALGAVTALVLIIGLVVWVATQDDEEVASTTSSVVAPSTSLLTATTAEPPPTTAAPSTTVETTSTTEASTTTSTSSSSTSTTTTVATGPSGETWTVTSPFFPEQPFEMSRVVDEAGVAVYDGRIDPGGPGVRCVAMQFAGVVGWQEWCGEPGIATRFVAVQSIDPWLVEVGTAAGDVTISLQPSTWSFPTNGCDAPIATLGGTAAIEPAVVTGVVCVPGEAFLTHSSVLLQQGPADGGGVLLIEGDEGWNSTGAGTSIDCTGWDDGVDRCELYDVEFELFEASLPVPPPSMLPSSVDIVQVRDETSSVRLWVGDSTDPAAIDAIVVDELVDPAAEVPAAELRSPGLASGRLDLLVVEVPQLDDSIGSTVHAVWISTDGGGVVRATAWETCTRGVTGGLCV